MDDIILALILFFSVIYFIWSSILLLEKLSSLLYKIFNMNFKNKHITDSQNSVNIKPTALEFFYALFRSLFNVNPFKSFFYSLVGILFYLSIKMPEIIPRILGQIYTAVLIYIIIRTITNLVVFNPHKGMTGIDFIDIFLSLLFIALLMLMFFASFLINIEDNSNVNFVVTVILIFMTLYPLTLFVKSIMDKQIKFVNFIIIFIVILLYEITLFLYFGAYNIAVNEEYMKLVNFEHEYMALLKIVQIGTINVFSFPGITSDIAYTAQYIIGFIVHVVIFGFFISYFSAKIIQNDGSNIR